jgi:tetratricopeptide (TPR) repeat protein
VAIAALLLVLLVLTVGGAWWFDRRETHRQAAAEAGRQQAAERVRGAVAQLPALRERFLWADGRAVLARARQEVDEFALDDLRAEVDQNERELTLAERLDDVYLDRVTAADEVGGGRQAAILAYRQAMREYGLDLEHGEHEELVRRVKASPNRDHLVSAIFVCATEKKAGAAKLLAVGKAAQPDEWTEVLRGISPGLPMAELQARVRERLAEVDTAKMSPWLLTQVGRLVGDKTGVELLRQAQRRSPSNFWVNMALASSLLRLGRPAEAVGYMRVALSVRPDRGVVYHNLANCLIDAHFREEALYYYREAVRREPHKARFREALDAAEKQSVK